MYRFLVPLRIVCLFWIRNRISYAESTPKRGSTESSPTPRTTRQPRALSLFFLDEPCPVSLDAYTETHVKQG